MEVIKMPNLDKTGPAGNKIGFGRGGCEEKQSENFGRCCGRMGRRMRNPGIQCDFAGQSEHEFLENKIKFFQERLDELKNANK
jgi:hypothetical protein